MLSLFRWTAPRWIAVIAASFALLGGVLSFLGWMSSIDRLRDWGDTGITIKANTTIALILISVALLVYVLRPASRIVIGALAGFVALLGAATLIQHPTGWNLGIDTLLFQEPAGAAATASPGRMGPPASLSFTVLGITLLLLVTRTQRFRSLTILLPLGVFGLTTLSIVGYWYGAAAMYTIPRVTGISIQTAIMLWALSIGMTAAQADREPVKTLWEDTTAGIFARRLLPAALLVPLVLGWLRLQGQKLDLFDNAFGTASRSVAEIFLFAWVMWSAVRAIRQREVLQRQAEDARQAGEQRLRSVLDASAVPFIVVAPVRDGSGTIIDFRWSYLNTAAADRVRKTPAELIGRRITDVAPDAWSEPGAFENFVAVAINREVRNFEAHTLTGDVEGWFQVVASPLEDTVAVWYADVTERKRHEFELRDADRRKDEFLATLAHELRNPLAPIRQAALLAKKPNVSDAQRQWCNEVIERQVEHMSLLLNDLLDVSRITRGILELRKQPTPLAALVDSAIETARPLLDSKRHTLHVDLPAQVAQLDVDPLRMSQVISNLLTNAAKYTNSGGIVRLSASIADRDFALSVADNGIGLAKEELGSIFTMFSQVKSAQERSEGGLGIGLALTKGLVQLHGGTIEGRSDGLGHGSTFTVRLPNAVLQVSQGQTRAYAPARPVLSRRILLADDNRDAVESLALLLRMDGHDVRIAHDGEMAVREYSTFDPDVLLLDLGMPRMSGYEVAKQVRASGSTALLIAITGWGQGSDRSKSAAAGFDHHLTKPVDYDSLTQLLAPNAGRERIAGTP